MSAPERLATIAARHLATLTPPAKETTMTAWHNNPDLKTAVVARMRAHREADEFIQGTYQYLDPDTPSGYRGCAIGCTLPARGITDPATNQRIGWHRAVEREYGIPIEIAYEIDDIFEWLPANKAGDFAVAVIEAIPVGADLEGVVAETDNAKYQDAETAEIAAELFIADLAVAPIPVAAAA